MTLEGEKRRSSFYILLDDRTARHEVELQFLACQHPNVARVVDVYENLFRDARCLFVVAEYMSGMQKPLTLTG
uniref:Protein kinase domain-containing protein n=1 Tax=Parascaris equorum TaxID=6256 RepID=A0A914R1X0_PAREQ